MSKVFVITGPSGVGKGTLIRSLAQQVPELEVSVSATTRPPRPGEVDGVDYHFLSEAEFDERLAAGDFVEHASYSGHRYGTLRSELECRLTAGAPGGAGDRDPGRASGPRDDARGGAGVHRPAVRRRAARAPRRPGTTNSPGDMDARLQTAREELAARTSSPTSS